MSIWDNVGKESSGETMFAPFKYFLSINMRPVQNQLLSDLHDKYCKPKVLKVVEKTRLLPPHRAQIKKVYRVSNNRVGNLMGRRGGNIKSLEERYNIKIKIYGEKGEEDRKVEVFGDSTNVAMFNDKEMHF